MPYWFNGENGRLCLESVSEQQNQTKPVWYRYWGEGVGNIPGSPCLHVRTSFGCPDQTFFYFIGILLFKYYLIILHSDVGTLQLVMCEVDLIVGQG